MAKKNRPKVAKTGKYKGEITLLGPKYPVTKNGKLYCPRVRSAKAFGVMHGDLKKLKKAGLVHYAAKCGFEA